jgi:hypothetical protein
MAASVLQDFGNGLGYVYITQADGTTVISNIYNDANGVQTVKSDALISAPLAGNIAAYGIINFGGAPANVTGLTVNGVSIISGVVAAAGTVALTVQAVRDNINAFASIPNYSAIAIGTTLYIVADPAAGSTPNGYAIAILTAMTTTITNMYGGTNTTGVYDVITGHRYFLNADYDASGCSGAVPAVEGDLTNSVEISEYVINRGFQTSLPSEAVSVASDQLVVPRISCITVLSVDTEGGGATDDLYVIDPTSFNIGDILILRATNFARQTTVRQAVGPSDNIQLANGSNFALGQPTRCIALELVSISGTLNWVEIFRSPNIDISVTNIRSTSNIAIPAQGVQDNVLTLAAQIISLTPGSSPEYQRITGSGVLAGNVSVVFAGTPKDGDHFFIDYAATVTLGAFSIVIGSITLTATQALQGGYMVYCYYEVATLTWHCQIWKNTAGEDLVDTVQLATKENSLGNPALNGYVLTSTTTGVRSWSPLNTFVLYDNVANNATTAVTVRENLKTYTLPAGVLDVDASVTGGSYIIVEAVFQTAANNNAKTFGISFGATDLITYSAAAPTNNTTIYMRATVNRVTQVAQSCIATYQNDGVANGLSYTTPVENLAGPVLIHAFGINGVASAADIISRTMTVTYI